MNIFVLDKDPVISASYYCDRHVVKMPVEIGQMLCNAISLDLNPIYKRTHYNHPVSKWVRHSRENYLWTIKHGLSVCKEYTNRYNKIHSSQHVIEWCEGHINDIVFEGHCLTEHPACVSIHCNRGDVVSSYREFYIKDKSYFAKWKDGNVPEWYKNEPKIS